MHLSTIFHTKASYVQSLPSGCEGFLALFGCFSLRKYHQMTFSKKYPEIKFSMIASKKKPFCENVCGGIKAFFDYIFEDLVLSMEAFAVALEWVHPNSNVITFEDLAEKKCCCEFQVHPDVETPAVAPVELVAQPTATRAAPRPLADVPSFIEESVPGVEVIADPPAPAAHTGRGVAVLLAAAVVGFVLTRALLGG